MIFCNHEYKLKKILYGDCINWYHGQRQIWQCTKCNTDIVINKK